MLQQKTTFLKTYERTVFVLLSCKFPKPVDFSSKSTNTTKPILALDTSD